MRVFVSVNPFYQNKFEFQNFRVCHNEFNPIRKIFISNIELFEKLNLTIKKEKLINF